MYFNAHLRAPYEYVEKTVLSCQSKASPLRILDLCCGTGIHGLEFAKHGCFVTGVDFSSRSIEAAQVAAKKLGLEGRSYFICGDALEFLHSSDDFFDFIVMSGSVYYFDLDCLFSAIVPRLSKNGRFICIETYGGNRILNLFRRLRSLVNPGRRDSQTMTKLLRNIEIARLQHFFPSSEVNYFDFLTLAAGLSKSWPVFSRVICQLLRPLDKVLLNKLRLTSLAFKFVLIGKK